MYKITYNKISGDILGWYNMSNNYNIIPEPYIEIDETKTNLILEDMKEFCVINSELKSRPIILTQQAIDNTKISELQSELNELKSDIECTELWNDTRVTWGKLPNTIYTNIDLAKAKCREIITEIRKLKAI